MAIQTPFSSLAEAQQAYYGDGGGGGGGGSSGGDGDGGDPQDPANWGEPVSVAQLEGGWTLARIDHLRESRSRYYVNRVTDGTLELIESDGSVTEAPPDATYSDIPWYDSESAARTAHEKWLGENGDGENGEDAKWGKWSPAREVPPWWVFVRRHKTEDRAEFLVSGVLEDGTTVYLAADGSVIDDPHVFSELSAVKEALTSYFQKVENGEIPEDRQPTGQTPDTDQVRRDAEGASGGGPPGGAGDLLGKLTDNPVALAAVGIGAVAYLSRGDN